MACAVKGSVIITTRVEERCCNLFSQVSHRNTPIPYSFKIANEIRKGWFFKERKIFLAEFPKINSVKKGQINTKHKTGKHLGISLRMLHFCSVLLKNEFLRPCNFLLSSMVKQMDLYY